MKNKHYCKEWEKFYIFPCKPNSKIPATKHGFKDAQKGLNINNIVVKGYNVGLALGLSGLIALDLDFHDENSTVIEDLKQLEAFLGIPLPRTLTQKTVTGKGLHLIFSSNGLLNPKGNIGASCDIKYNGYILIAPSTINGKQYKIIDGIDENESFIIADLPQVWIDYLNNKIPLNHNRSKLYDRPIINQSKFKWKKVAQPLNYSIDKIVEKCNFLKYCKSKATELSEPLWFSMISILAPIQDSDEVIHEFSKPYPNYSYNETQAKINRVRNFNSTPSCAYLSSTYPEICGNCSSNVINKGENKYERKN